MHYYEVYVAESNYQKQEPLTYSCDRDLKSGTIVAAPYGRRFTNGFVWRKVAKPDFPTKTIEPLYEIKALPERTMKLFEWVMSYYPSGAGAVAQMFVPSGIATKHRKSQEEQPAIHKPLPRLTKQQTETIDKINQSPNKSFLLHGETGSGKTRIYIERTRAALEKGLSALVLTPEISLIPQLEEIFKQEFGSDVYVIHSGLTKSKRNRNWLGIVLSDKPVVIIGTRSALFCPVKSLGFIAVDEMHEPAYKQEQAPRYYGLRVAGALAKIHDAEIIYGSATPPVVEYFVAKSSDTPVLRMTETAIQAGNVKRTIIDMKDKSLLSRHPMLSTTLLTALEHNLAKNRQSMLFLNRRGTARLVLCQACGWQAVCPRCDLPLTYHGDNHTLRCHTCGYRSSPPYACPACGNDEIKYRSIGTKALVDSLHSLLPEAVIKRFDTDNLANEKLSQHYDDIKAGKIDILVGTQMLGKGLDLPHLSLVGIVNADAGLNMPDFSAAERNYQLLHQAIGRVGRGHTHGEVIVQTYNPHNQLLEAAVRQDWQSLYDQEIKERELYGFPPYKFILKIDVSRKTARSAETFTSKLHEKIKTIAANMEISDPAPAFYERAHGQYHWQLIIRSRSRSRLVKLVTSLPAGDFTYDLDPINLL